MGVLVSRSSLHWIKFEKIWLLALLQFTNFIIFLLQVGFYFPVLFQVSVLLVPFHVFFLLVLFQLLFLGYIFIVLFHAFLFPGPIPAFVSRLHFYCSIPCFPFPRSYSRFSFCCSIPEMTKTNLENLKKDNSNKEMY